MSALEREYYDVQHKRIERLCIDETTPARDCVKLELGQRRVLRWPVQDERSGSDHEIEIGEFYSLALLRSHRFPRRETPGRAGWLLPEGRAD
ncbi:hypothetical protein AWL63_23145 (plasmid) [Sphingomonas panacis]|uniref:Uncharacterized protein n=1 Tax=Sphingomonas panacis TaxID=1560345 RepID=A0A1B3ZI54_9SPHN|nr:hypothetical protein [Sphingomonas panacis]AOH87083.1 hypothetical protein AWL63_23145 [Sphingomonas panacis]